MTVDPNTMRFAKRFEPILLFHPDERFFPIDPKLYLERCALWRSDPASDEKTDWGEIPKGKFPRRPLVAKGALSALRAAAGSGKTWIGEPSNLVLPEQDGERALVEDRFLQLAGWKPFVSAPDEVTASSDNRHPTLDQSTYAGALAGSKPWYYAEHFTNPQLLSAFGKKTPHGADLFRAVIDNTKFSAPELLVYHYFYALHEEPLRGCEEAGDGETFATFAGEWTSVAILLNSASEPLFVGLTSRNVGDPLSLRGEENRLGMRVHAWKDVDRVGEHAKIFVSRGTHGNYLKPGPHELRPFTPGDIDLNQGTCAQIEKLDDVIPGGEGVPATEGEDTDWWALVVKSKIATPFFGAIWLVLEGGLSSFGGAGVPALEPNRKPLDETGGPSFGTILRPNGLFVPEQASAQHTEDWPMKAPEPTGPQQPLGFIVDRETELWWPPLNNSPGYVGRWGPRVTNDPKLRRSGMRCPSFALLFLEAITRL